MLASLHNVLCDFSSVDEQLITAKIHTSVRVHAFIGANYDLRTSVKIIPSVL